MSDNVFPCMCRHTRCTLFVQKQKQTCPLRLPCKVWWENKHTTITHMHRGVPLTPAPPCPPKDRSSTTAAFPVDLNKVNTNAHSEAPSSQLHFNRCVSPPASSCLLLLLVVLLFLRWWFRWFLQTSAVNSLSSRWRVRRWRRERRSQEAPAATSLFPCLHLVPLSVWPVISLFLGRSCCSAPVSSALSVLLLFYVLWRPSCLGFV